MTGEALRRELQALLSLPVLFDEPLAGYTSMGVGGPADALAQPVTPEEAGRLLAFLTERAVPCCVAGNWTNLIVRDGGYRGVVLCLRRMRTIRVEEDPAGGGRITAQAGALLSELVGLCTEKAWAGLAFAAGIPGSLGGAVRMNAGAYGHAMQEVLSTVSVMDPRGRTETFPASGLAFRYRSLDLTAGHLVVEATLSLQAGDGEGIRAEVREILALRRRKHPLAYRNAGSIFRNPPEGPAGRIIEEAGLKGLAVGDAQVSTQHANFIVNRGKATARDITTLMERIQDRVWETARIRLEPEVVIIGDES